MIDTVPVEGELGKFCGMYVFLNYVSVFIDICDVALYPNSRLINSLDIDPPIAI
jgi:hypothetical protein